MEKVIFQDLGRIGYRQAWALQQSLHDAMKERKIANRRAGISDFHQDHYLLFCEHDPVYTLGKSGSEDHLLLKEGEAESKGFEFFKINRGGDITYHGPGQVVAYPILDLDRFFTDVHKYVRTLEEVVIRMLAEYEIEAGRIDGYTGVWLKGARQRKICALGVHLSRWVTMHGFALNVNTQLNHFNHIVPCGIQEESKEVTSMERELGRPISQEEVKNKLKRHFSELFEFQYSEVVAVRD